MLYSLSFLTIITHVFTEEMYILMGKKNNTSLPHYSSFSLWSCFLNVVFCLTVLMHLCFDRGINFLSMFLFPTFCNGKKINSFIYKFFLVIKTQMHAHTHTCTHARTHTNQRACFCLFVCLFVFCWKILNYNSKSKGVSPDMENFLDPFSVFPNSKSQFNRKAKIDNWGHTECIHTHKHKHTHTRHHYSEHLVSEWKWGITDHG